MRVTWWCILLLLITSSVNARSVYRYVDKNGVVSFTDELNRAQPFNPVELEIWEPDPNS